jgi:small conductance mechanosensitive channel
MSSRAPVGPELEEACGEAPGVVCRLVFERTDSEGWAKFAGWLVSRPLKILAILLVAYLLNRLVRRVITRFAERMAGVVRSGRLRRLREEKIPLLLSEANGDATQRAAARAQTIGLVLRSLASGVIWTFAVLYVVAAAGLQLGPLLAGAGIAGVAIGFGAQSLVKDFLAGLFILMEDQYGVGDVVDLGPAVGTVEEVTLRTTRLRDVNGTVWHVPNGEIRRVGNSSQQWARSVLDLSVPYGTDLERALGVLEEVADEAAASLDLADDLLEAPQVWGVEHVALDGVTLRMVVKTRPGAQFEVTRILRARVMEAFSAAGIGVPETTQRAEATPDDVRSDEAPPPAPKPPAPALPTDGGPVTATPSPTDTTHPQDERPRTAGPPPADE